MYCKIPFSLSIIQQVSMCWWPHQVVCWTIFRTRRISCSKTYSVWSSTRPIGYWTSALKRKWSRSSTCCPVSALLQMWKADFYRHDYEGCFFWGGNDCAVLLIGTNIMGELVVPILQGKLRCGWSVTVKLLMYCLWPMTTTLTCEWG